MAERSYVPLFWLLALIGIGLDQAGKYTVFAALENSGHGGVREIVPGVFQLLVEYTGPEEPGTGPFAWLRTRSSSTLPKVNRGALFGAGGSGSQISPAVANAGFAIISIFAAGAIVYWSGRRSTRHDRFLCISLGLILAGTVGNLYDRVVFGGVRDFLHFYWIEWPVFNIADCCLVVGAFLLLAQAFLTKPATAPSRKREVALASEAD